MYNKLKLYVVPLRTGLTMGVPVQPTPLAVMDDEVQALQQQLAAAVAKRDRRVQRETGASWWVGWPVEDTIEEQVI